MQGGDFAGIQALLADNATLAGDGGGKVQTFPKPLEGARRIAQLFYATRLRYPGEGLRVQLVRLNGEWALLRYFDGALESAQTFVVEGDRIARIHVQRNPDKLARIAARFGGDDAK